MLGKKSVGTDPEALLTRMIWLAGYRGYRKKEKNVPVMPDVYFARLWLAILMNNCFWHRCL